MGGGSAAGPHIAPIEGLMDRILSHDLVVRHGMLGLWVFSSSLGVLHGNTRICFN